jgi:hypothetical protein
VKALTIHEPWASLLAVGAKRVETRGWPTRHRGPLAIHAGRRWTRGEQDAWDDLGWISLRGRRPALGCVVALGQLVACERMTLELIASQASDRISDELAFGAWDPGRWAWRLEGVVALPEPIAVRGKQGLWDLPDNVARAVLAAAEGVRRG